jgi:hypothetical protein
MKNRDLLLSSFSLVPHPASSPPVNRVFFRLAVLLVVAIARYDSSSRLASRKNPSISFGG